jgi:hypothetical protein
MKVLCICPTYGRPRHLVENAIACFEAQTHPDRFLLIVDDGGTVPVVTGNRWVVLRAPSRLAGLPTKYNLALGLAAAVDDTKGEGRWSVDYTKPLSSSGYGAVAVWDDDDVYLPHHLADLVAALQTTGKAWAKPEAVLSDYLFPTGAPEPSRGRFHGSILVRWAALQALGGWPDHPGVDYDQVFMHQLEEMFGPPAGTNRDPGYCYRWRGTGALHASAHSGPTWYTDYPAQVTTPWEGLVPCLDGHAQAIYDRWAT